MLNWPSFNNWEGFGLGFGMLLYLVRKYRESQWGWCETIVRMENKVVIVTGANSGIGFETAKELALRGARVVMACRNGPSAITAIQKIKKCNPDAQLEYIYIDLADLQSVRKFVYDFLQKYDRLDVLINNAGVYMPNVIPRISNKEGLEIHFAVNHLGHFLLTEQLKNILIATPKSRVLIVSSELYKSAHLDLDDIPHLKDENQGFKARNLLYSNSKLANLLHAHTLSRELWPKNVAVCSISPGFVYTNLSRHTFSSPFGFLVKLLFIPIVFFFMRSAKQGAQTSIYCATSKTLVFPKHPATYYQNCKPVELLPVAFDEDMGDELEKISRQLVKQNNQ